MPLEVFLNQRSAYGERQTARILTGTPFLVNTAKWPVTSRSSLIYQACGQFKQTFVLDLQGGVDIMRPFNEARAEIAACVRFCTLHIKKHCEP